mgnify:FL=1
MLYHVGPVVWTDAFPLVFKAYFSVFLLYYKLIFWNTFREAPDVVLQKDVIEDPRYLGLHKQDRTKVGLNVSFLE